MSVVFEKPSYSSIKPQLRTSDIVQQYHLVKKHVGAHVQCWLPGTSLKQPLDKKVEFISYSGKAEHYLGTVLVTTQKRKEELGVLIEIWESQLR